MDEPFGALDSQTRELLQEELQAIWRRDRKTALFVTHDIDEAIYLGTRRDRLHGAAGPHQGGHPHPRQVDRSGDLPQVAGIPRACASQVWDLLREEVLKARALEEA